MVLGVDGRKKGDDGDGFGGSLGRVEVVFDFSWRFPFGGVIAMIEI